MMVLSIGQVQRQSPICQVNAGKRPHPIVPVSHTSSLLVINSPLRLRLDIHSYKNLVVATHPCRTSHISIRMKISFLPIR